MCGACPAPAANGAATCDGTKCDIACNPGYHNCGGNCVSNNSTSSCGTTSCNTCPTQANGVATCDGTNCGIACNTGYHNCGGSCVSNNSTSSCGTTSCNSCPVPNGGVATCDGTNCGTAFSLTVTATGTGTVTSVPAGINCTAPCTATASFPPGTVTLQARTANGSGYVFSGFGGGGCTGPARDCAVAVSGATSVTATFTKLAANLVFITSSSVATNLGSATAYDAICNTAATAAGINDAGGLAYVAATSDAKSNLIDRLKSARGWVRMDGKPFADSQSALFTTGQVFYPVMFDETGKYGSENYATGTTSTGTATGVSQSAGDCTGWTGTGNQLSGYSEGGTMYWVAGLTSSCYPSIPFLCMGTSRSAAVAPAAATGPKIWYSGAFTAGTTMTPDQTCQASRPTGVTTAAALVSYANKAASAVLQMGSSYARLDGSIVGTGASIAAGRIDTGIWQSATGAYGDPFLVWAGSPTPGQAGTTASTCNNWTDATGTAATTGQPTVLGHPQSPPGYRWWSEFSNTACNFPGGLFYCVQTAP
jgi:hypothetical protein